MDLHPTKRSTRPAKAAPAPSHSSSENSLGRGMEFAIVLAAFLGVGYVLDRWLDTKPLFMIVLVVLSLVGQFASMWYGYDARMRELESERLANTTGATRVGKSASGHRATAGHVPAPNSPASNSPASNSPASNSPASNISAVSPLPASGSSDRDD